MSEFRIVREYAHPPADVWRGLTDPALIPRWTTEGLGARADGFGTDVGTHFRYVAPPQRFWRGIVDCEVLESRPPSWLRYSWIGDLDEPPTFVSYLLEPTATGTRFTFEHTGFTGIGGFFVARALRRVRTKMLTAGLPSVLATLPAVR